MHYSIVILGDYFVGKTSIINRLINDSFDITTYPTIGTSYFSKEIKLDNNINKIIKFSLWDTAGQERFRSFVTMYLKNANIIYLCFDINKLETFENLKIWMKLIEKHVLNENYIGFLIGTKLDIKKRQIEENIARNYADNIGFFYYETSSKNNINIDTLFEFTIDTFVKKNNNKIKKDLEYENNVNNDIKQGGKHNKSYIITGPNGGGKSTYLRCIGLNILFSQTFGFGNCKNGYLTPYSHVDTYMYIPDKEGYESLFQAEVSRCKNIIDNIDNEFYYLIVDEIFNSTNPVEGISSSYSFINLLNNYKNILGIYSTHFGYITELGKKNNIGNLKVNIERNNGKILFPYKIEKGISNEYIALELLKEKGFDDSFIENAINIKKKINSEFNFCKK